MVERKPAEELKASLSQNTWAIRQQGAVSMCVCVCVHLSQPHSHVPKFRMGMLSTLLWSNGLNNNYIPTKVEQGTTELSWAVLQLWQWKLNWTCFCCMVIAFITSLIQANSLDSQLAGLTSLWDTCAISWLISWSETRSTSIAAQHRSVPEPANFWPSFEAYMGSEHHILTNSSWHWRKLRETPARIYWTTEVYFEKQCRSCRLLVPIQLY